MSKGVCVQQVMRTLWNVIYYFLKGEPKLLVFVGTHSRLNDKSIPSGNCYISSAEICKRHSILLT